MEDTYGKRLSRNCYYVCLGIIAVSIITYIVLQILGIPITQLNSKPCVWITFFGVYCPGCGGTRAVEAFMKGDFIQSFLYHPVVPYVAIFVLCYVFSHTLNILTKGKTKAMAFRSVYLYALLAIILLQWLIKNILKLAFFIELC